MAQMSEPDMRIPIQYAMTYPERLETPVKPLDLVRAGRLTFEAPDLVRFPCLRLAREAGMAGGSAPCVLNAANEIAVQAFLDRRIRFTEIPRIIEECLEKCAGPLDPSWSALREADRAAREEAQNFLRERSPVLSGGAS
jgi:1-deoxy-D-xylulose-5-phosphate reductoisomerase